MTLPPWNTQLWSQGNTYLPYKTQDQQHYFRICLRLTVIEKHHQVCELYTSGLKSQLIPDLHIQQGARLYIFLILKGHVNLGNRPRCPSFSFFQEFPCWLRSIEYNSQELIKTSFFPSTARKIRHWLSLIHQHGKSVTVKLHPVSVWLGPSCDLLPVTAVPDCTALHVLCRSY